MSADERCPHCAARIPAAAEWCTQCYASLRKPAPVAAAPASPAPVTAQHGPAGRADPLGDVAAAPVAYSGGTPLAAAAAAGLADPLTAPLPVVGVGPEALAAVGAVVTEAPVVVAGDAAQILSPPTPLPTWPCTTCQTRNAMDAMTCSGCSRPFGAELSDIPKVPGTRQSRILSAIIGVVVLLTIVGVLAWVMTPEAPPKDAPLDVPPGVEIVDE